MKRNIFLLITALMAVLLCSCGSSKYKYIDSDEYKIGNFVCSDKIVNIDIDWLDGEVSIEHYDKNEISVSEASNMVLTDNITLHYMVSGDKIFIKYCASGESGSLINLNKKLIVKIPRNVSLDKVNVSTTNGNVVTDLLSAQNIAFTTATGDISAVVENSVSLTITTTTGNVDVNAEDVSQMKVTTSEGAVDTIIKNVGGVELTTATGAIDVKQKGKTESLRAESATGKIDVKANDILHPEINSTSGNLKLKLKNCPKVIDVRATSGKVNIQLPYDAQFTASVKSASGDFDCDFDEVTRNGKTYTRGDGSCDINISTTSGDMQIKPIEEDDK